MKKKLFLVVAFSLILILAGCSQNDKLENVGELETLGFKFSGETIEMNTGESKTFELTTKDVNGKNVEADINWVVSDNKLVNITNTTKNSITIKAKSPGVTEIKAEYNGKIDTIKVNIKASKNVYGYVTNGRGEFCRSSLY